MMTYNVNSISDMDLVAESLGGNRDAFGQIVSRYQNLICSLAYSATGNLSQSEDLAQETFFAAWKQLGDLREPAKLRAWLCGIARNLINTALRRQGREPVHHAETLDTVEEAPAVERAPGEHAISNEEQAILWRSLERIPDIYREPLVLFYREHQSIEAVAQSLELSEDAVKQRLSRGRKMLQEEVASFVEGALRQSAPGQAFAGAVLSALPIKTVTMASAGASAAKSGGLLSFLTLPLIGLLGSAFGSVWVVRNAKNPTHRRAMVRGMSAIWLSVLWVIVAQNVSYYLRHRFGWSDHAFALAQVFNFGVFAFLLLTWQVLFFNHRRNMSSQLAEGSARNPGGPSPAPRNKMFTGVGGVIAWCGMVVGAFGWMVNIALDTGDLLAAGIIITVGVVLMAWPCYMAAYMGEGQAFRSRLSFVPSVGIHGLILLMVNWRLDLWIAAGNGSQGSMGLMAAHQLLPMWIVHVVTLGLLAWVGVLLLIRKPKEAVAA